MCHWCFHLSPLTHPQCHHKPLVGKPRSVWLQICFLLLVKMRWVTRALSSCCFRRFSQRKKAAGTRRAPLSGAVEKARPDAAVFLLRDAHHFEGVDVAVSTIVSFIDLFLFISTIFHPVDPQGLTRNVTSPLWPAEFSFPPPHSIRIRQWKKSSFFKQTLLNVRNNMC